MTHVYNRGLRVSPFIIAPIGLMNREAAIVLGPRSLAKRSDDLIHILYFHIEEQNLNCPVIAQFIPYENGVLITTTIQTRVPDANSDGRLGLKLTYGALISKDIFLHHSNVCTRVFELLNLYYFQKQFGAPASIEIAEKIVSSLQRTNQRSDEILGQDETDELLNRFESELCISDRSPLTAFKRAILRFRWHRLLKWPKLKPLICLGDSAGFWSDIDTSLRLTRVVPQARDIRSNLDTIALTVPKTTLAVLKRIAISRDLSDQELVISYIEQESRRDLAILVGDPGLRATAKVLAQHIQSEDEVLAIVCEIRGEAIAQAKMDEPS